MVNAKYWLIVPASGVGKRMQQKTPKQYLLLGDKTVIEYALAPFLELPQIEKIVVVIAADDKYFRQLAIANHPKIVTATGGAERYHSVVCGLTALQSDAAGEDWVLVHDAARPLITQNEIMQLIQSTKDHPVGGLLGMPITATVKRVDAENKVLETIPRQQLWQAATPQIFRYELLTNALGTVSEKQVPSDCAQSIEQLGYTPLMVECSQRNFKITGPADLALAEKILRD